MKKDLRSRMEPINGNKMKEQWSGRFEFILSIIGYSVGFSNVWRFPYLCYRNGGVAFLIPYIIMLCIAGIPLFFLEFIIGQYSSLGPSTVWRLCPLFRGIGIAMIVQTAMIVCYYNTILGYVLFYLFDSMRYELPWTSCNNYWNTMACSSFDHNSSDYMMSMTLPRRSAAEEYFENKVLQMSSGLDDIGSLRWELFGCLLGAWILVFLCIIRGIKSSGKVVYFTALFPYVMLLILLIRNLTLPGAMDGLKYYLFPNFASLLNLRAWGDAATQIFYNLGPCWGGMILLSSYNKFHNNCHRDAIITSLVSSGTPLFAGLVVFSTLGFLALDLGMTIDRVVTAGPGLAFVVYPEAISRMPAAPFWSITFFLTMLTVGLDTMFTLVEVIIVGLMEEFPGILGGRRLLVTITTCIFFFLVGIPQVTQGGIYLLTLIDWYSSCFSLLFIGILEVVVIIYIYGYRNLAYNVEVMLGYRPNVYFIACWFVLTPLSSLLLLIFQLYSFQMARYYDYEYSTGWQVAGFLIALLPVIIIPAYMIYHILRTLFGSANEYRGFVGFLKQIIKPDPRWGPMLPENRAKAGLPPLPGDSNPQELSTFGPQGDY